VRLVARPMSYSSSGIASSRNGVEGVITGARPIDCERNLPIRKMPALEAISLMLKLKRGIGPEIWIAIVFCILY
jgi:hypothetical protein